MIKKLFSRHPYIPFSLALWHTLFGGDVKRKFSEVCKLLGALSHLCSLHALDCPQFLLCMDWIPGEGPEDAYPCESMLAPSYPFQRLLSPHGEVWGYTFPSSPSHIVLRRKHLKAKTSLHKAVDSIVPVILNIQMKDTDKYKAFFPFISTIFICLEMFFLRFTCLCVWHAYMCVCAILCIGAHVWGTHGGLSFMSRIFLHLLLKQVALIKPRAHPHR